MSGWKAHSHGYRRFGRPSILWPSPVSPRAAHSAYQVARETRPGVTRAYVQAVPLRPSGARLAKCNSVGAAAGNRITREKLHRPTWGHFGRSAHLPRLQLPDVADAARPAALQTASALVGRSAA